MSDERKPNPPAKPAPRTETEPPDPRFKPTRGRMLAFHNGIGTDFIGNCLKSFTRTITAGEQKRWTGVVEIQHEPWHRMYRVTEVEGDEVRSMLFPENWAAMQPEVM